MIEENSVATTDGSLAVTFRIECKTQAWSCVEQMSLHASDGNASDAALHHAVERISRAGNDGSGLASRIAIRVVNQRSLGRAPDGGIEVVGLVIALAIGSEQADSEAKIQSQTVSNTKIILEVRFQNFVAVVVLGLRA